MIKRFTLRSILVAVFHFLLTQNRIPKNEGTTFNITDKLAVQ